MAAQSDADVALATVRDADLRYPDGEFLKSFIWDAVDRQRAAAYVLHRCSVDTGGLPAIARDWKEVVSICTFRVVGAEL